MSDTPPDRKEAGDAPAAPRNPWVTWLVWLFLAPMLYVLSIGPVYRLVERGYLPENGMSIYTPLFYLGSDFKDLIGPYIQWWRA